MKKQRPEINPVSNNEPLNVFNTTINYQPT